jgi:hypothetical protein
MVPRAHPVLSETKVTDSGSKLAAAGAAAGAGADATASPLANPITAKTPATSPAHTAIDIDIDRHDLIAFMWTRIRRSQGPIADPGWPDLPIRPGNRGSAKPSGPSGIRKTIRRALRTDVGLAGVPSGEIAFAEVAQLAGLAPQEPLELGGYLVACGQVGELDGR